MTESIEPQPVPALKDNPLVCYLNVLRNQHKVISILYRAIITTFTSFTVLLSLFIYSISSSDVIPSWGLYSLVIIDILLIIGVYKATSGLNKYRIKSSRILKYVYSYLKDDLLKLEKIKHEHAEIVNTHQKIQKKVLSYSSKTITPGIYNYSGWDNHICPKCQTSVELLKETCPQCQYGFGKTLVS